MALCPEFTGITTIADILVWPTSCNYNFYLIFFITFFVVLSLILYNKEKESLIRSDAVSSMGVSAIATFFLALTGTFIQNSAGIPMVQQDIFLYVLAGVVVFVVIWFFKR